MAVIYTLLIAITCNEIENTLFSVNTIKIVYEQLYYAVLLHIHIQNVSV